MGTNHRLRSILALMEREPEAFAGPAEVSLAGGPLARVPPTSGTNRDIMAGTFSLSVCSIQVMIAQQADPRSFA